MKSDINGCSTCQVGQESFEEFNSHLGKKMIQYDFKNHDGELFSTIAPSLEIARLRRDVWLTNKS